MSTESRTSFANSHSPLLILIVVLLESLLSPLALIACLLEIVTSSLPLIAAQLGLIPMTWHDSGII